MVDGSTTMVTIRRRDADRLRALARRRETTVDEVVHAAIEALERQEFLRTMGDDYRRLRENTKRWESYRAERAEWDAVD